MRCLVLFVLKLLLIVLQSPDRWVRLRVNAVHQPIGAVQAIRRRLNLRSQIGRCTNTPYRDSKGWLNAFGRVSFVTFLWRNKEKLIYGNTLMV